MRINKIQLLLALGLGCLSSLHAASLAVTNLTGGPSDVAVVNSSGSAISGGFAAIFQWNSAPTDYSSLQANGNTGLLQQLALVPGNYPGGGALSTDFTALANNGTTAAGGPLYLVFGNGADVASSAELGMLSLGITLDGDDTPTPDDYGTYFIDNADIAIGTAGSGTYDWSGSTGQSSRNIADFRLTGIPEPSTSLLSLLGLALLIRRRR